MVVSQGLTDPGRLRSPALRDGRPRAEAHAGEALATQVLSLGTSIEPRRRPGAEKAVLASQALMRSRMIIHRSIWSSFHFSRLLYARCGLGVVFCVICVFYVWWRATRRRPHHEQIAYARSAMLNRSPPVWSTTHLFCRRVALKS